MRRFRNQTDRFRKAHQSDCGRDRSAGENMSIETMSIKESLLVVDDEEMNRNMFSRRLERAGFRVEVARDGAEALRMMDQQTFDLVLLDQMMPEQSGSDVLRELRRVHSAGELPVIMVTAVADSGK